MTEQQKFEFCVRGVLAQGFVYQGFWVSLDKEIETGKSCRCHLGQLMNCETGRNETGTGPANLPVRWSKLADVNDECNTLEEYRMKMAEYARSRGWNDAVCWEGAGHVDP